MKKDVFINHLHQTADPRQAIKAVNPQTTDGQAAHADRLLESPLVEERMRWLLEEERKAAIAAMAADMQITLMTMVQKRALLNRMMAGEWKCKKHVKLRNVVVEVYEEMDYREMMAAMRLDNQMEEKMLKLMAAGIDLNTEPVTMTVPGRDVASPALPPEPPRTEHDNCRYNEEMRYRVMDSDPYDGRTVYRAEPSLKENDAPRPTVLPQPVVMPATPPPLPPFTPVDALFQKQEAAAPTQGPGLQRSAHKDNMPEREAGQLHRDTGTVGSLDSYIRKAGENMRARK